MDSRQKRSGMTMSGLSAEQIITHPIPAVFLRELATEETHRSKRQPLSTAQDKLKNHNKAILQQGE
jgi:hypothetical protein